MSIEQLPHELFEHVIFETCHRLSLPKLLRLQQVCKLFNDYILDYFTSHLDDFEVCIGRFCYRVHPAFVERLLLEKLQTYDRGRDPLIDAIRQASDYVVSKCDPSEESRVKHEKALCYLAARNGDPKLTFVTVAYQKPMYSSSMEPALPEYEDPLDIALVVATYYNDVVTMQLLINEGANPNLSPGRFGSPLIIASQKRCAEAVRLLLKSGANPNLSTERFESPLLVASRQGCTRVAGLLLNSGANPNLSLGRFGSPLSSASRQQCVELVGLEFGARDIELDCKGWNALHWAASFGHASIVQQLLAQKDVDVHCKTRKSGSTPLILALRGGHEDIVHLLLCRNDIEIRNQSSSHYGVTPLHVAAASDNESFAPLLLAHWQRRNAASVSSEDLGKQHSTQPFQAMTHEYYWTARRWITYSPGSFVNALDIDCRTPLMYAAIHGHEAAAKVLLNQADVELNLKVKYGQTALSYATANGHEAVVKLLQSGNICK